MNAVYAALAVYATLAVYVVFAFCYLLNLPIVCVEVLWPSQPNGAGQFT